jgi:DNA-binding response OmpR family regulator
MPRILLIDPDKRLTKTLRPVLERKNYSVRTGTSAGDILNWLGHDDAQCDVIVMELSRNREADWQMLDRIRSASLAAIAQPMILFVSDRNPGPEVRLAVELKGARLAIFHE